MSDPLSIAASALAIITAAIQSARALNNTISRFQDRDKRLRRLQGELDDLANILTKLTEILHAEPSVLSLLKGPVSRCEQLCRDFEGAMNTFSAKPTMGIRDWTKMEFMRGDINDFIDTLSGYKSTISVGLGTIVMHKSILSHEVFEEYNEMIKDTTHELQIHLRRIDDKLASLTTGNGLQSDTGVDLEDEKDVTRQCLRICEDARTYIESLTERDPSIQHHAPEETTTGPSRLFEAQRLTRDVLGNNRDTFSQLIGRLQERLVAMEDMPRNDRERARLEQDIATSRQCLEVCKLASNEVSHQKVYRVGEAVADGDSDQVVVSTLADLFDVRKALSKGKSAQLIGLMTDETLQQMSADRYGSRFGTHANGTQGNSRKPAAADTQTGSIPPPPLVSRGPPQGDGQAKGGKPHPNEVRKRATDGGGGGAPA